MSYTVKELIGHLQQYTPEDTVLIDVPGLSRYLSVEDLRGGADVENRHRGRLFIQTEDLPEHA